MKIFNVYSNENDIVVYLLYFSGHQNGLYDRPGFGSMGFLSRANVNGAMMTLPHSAAELDTGTEGETTKQINNTQYHKVLHYEVKMFNICPLYANCMSYVPPVYPLCVPVYALCIPVCLQCAIVCPLCPMYVTHYITLHYCLYWQIHLLSLFI